MFSSPLCTKLFCTVFLALSCMGNRGVKDEKISWKHIAAAGGIGILLFYGNGWLLGMNVATTLRAALYTATLLAGFLGMLAAGLWSSRLLKNRMTDDPFNAENESFMQETRLLKNDDSFNFPTEFVFRRRRHSGWINVVNPFRGRRRTNRAISVKLIYWLKLNVNNLKSAIWVKQRKITENIRKGMTSGWLGTSVGNYRFCFPEFPTNLRTLTGLNSIILSQFGMCK